MAITKPYTFQAGTKARAGEVNQDFDILYSEVNRLGTEVLNIDVDIQDILSSKADVNGNATQRFQMANPEASYDGVNKTYLENAIANIKDYISGYVITKDTDNTIIVSPGSCYDSGFNTIIISTGNITKENTNQGANATYYVHAIADNTGRQVDILISPEAISPALPSGYTLYRQIGKITTDADSHIDFIYNYGVNNDSPSPNAIVLKSYVNGNSGYRVWSDKYCEQWGSVYRGRDYNEYTISLLIEMVNTNYNITYASNYVQTAGDKGCSWAWRTKNTTNFTARNAFEQGGGTVDWKICGYAK